MKPRKKLLTYLLALPLGLAACQANLPSPTPNYGEGSVPYSTENAPDEVQELYTFAEEWVTNQRGGLVAPPLSNPQFHYITIPSTGEVPQTAIDFEFMAKLLDFFFLNSDRGQMAIAGNVFENMTPPAQHLIVFLNRTTDIPKLVLERGEATVVSEMEDGRLALTSFIALNGPNSDSDTGLYWNIAQAFCLGFTQNTANNDAYCNIFAANAAAAYVGLDQATAKQWVESFETTELPSNIAGSVSAQYKFDPIIFESFKK